MLSQKYFSMALSFEFLTSMGILWTNFPLEFPVFTLQIFILLFCKECWVGNLKSWVNEQESMCVCKRMCVYSEGRTCVYGHKNVYACV